MSLTDPADDTRNLAALRAQLAVKSATFSSSHPDVRALKRQIEALEKGPGSAGKTGVTAGNDAPQKDVVPGTPTPQGIDNLLTQKIGIRQDLNTTTQKLSAARLGEGLERGQHSERLEVIEQATVPSKPTSPNRPKIFAFVLAFALMAGGGLLVGTEMLNPVIRRSTDLFSLIDSQMIVAIPHIRTIEEVKGKKRKHIYTAGFFAAIVVAALTAILFILPPLDLLFDKIMTSLLR